MRKNHPDSNRIIWKIRVSERERKIIIHIVIKIEESLFIQLHKCGARDGFCNGGNNVDSLVDGFCASRSEKP